MGSVWSPKTWPYTTNNPSVVHVRHAIALDERRSFFRQNRWGSYRPEGHTLEEVWFAGVHSDVGGGYPANENDLWTHPLEWMAKEAEEKELLLKPNILGGVIEASREVCRNREKPSPLHDSMKGAFPLWYIAEFVPKPRRREIAKGEYRTEIIWPVRHWFMPWLMNTGKMGRARAIGRARMLNAGEQVHRSAIQRFHDDPTYRPDSLVKIGMTEAKAKEFLDTGAETYPVPRP
jgi:hypothetical protein